MIDMRVLRVFLLLACVSRLPAQTEPLRGGFRVARAFPGLSIGAVLVDPADAVIVIGATTAAGLPVTADAPQSDYKYSGCGPIIGPGFPNVQSCPNLYVARFATDGSLTFGTYLGSTGGVVLYAAALNRAGDLYLAANAGGPDFPVSLTGASQGHFLLRMQQGNMKVTLAQAFSLGPQIDPARMALDGDGNIYLAGSAYSGLAVTPGVLQPASGGQRDGFLAKLSPAADRTLWATYLGGAGNDAVIDLAIGTQGNIYVCGSTSGGSFPTTAGAWVQVAPPTPLASAIFVSVIDPGGTRLLASAEFGGESSDYPYYLALAPDGGILVAGNTTSAQFPVTAGAFQTAKLDLTSVFLVKFAPDLSAPVYSTLLGGEGSDYISGVIARPDGSAILTGSTTSRFFPVTADSLERCNRTLATTLSAGFVTHISADGSRLLYSSFFNFDDYASSLGPAAATADGRIVLTGSENHTYDLTYYGGPAGSVVATFMGRLDPEAAPPRSRFCVLNSASFASGFATPGQLMTLFADNIGPAQPQQSAPDASGVYPTQLAGIRVLVDGVATGLFYADSQQVNAWLPQVGLRAPVQVSVEVDGAVKETANLVLTDSAPGLFRNYGFATAAAVNEDGSPNSADHPAARGGLLTLYGTGFGATAPLMTQPAVVTDQSVRLNQLPQIFIGSLPAQVVFDGQAPYALPGLTAIQVRAPEAGSGLTLLPVDYAVGYSFALGNVSVWVK